MGGAVEPSPHQAEQAASASMSLPWCGVDTFSSRFFEPMITVVLFLCRWVRYTRWKPTSEAERSRAERKLLAVTGYEVLSAEFAVPE